jgi:pSer/pThr/pTyr-binding forkhead associated (FHA) protein
MSRAVSFRVVQLDILSGKKAGTTVVARRFPFQIGRAADSPLPLDDAGVWERHGTLAVHHGETIVLSVNEGALATVNGDPVKTAELKNGDVITLGAARVRFTLSPARQRNQTWREAATWIMLVLLCLGQGAIIYLLLD